MTPTPTRARLVELLATEATQKLTPAERNELAALVRAFPDEDPDALDLAAAAVHLALSGPAEEMPAALAEKLYVASVAMAPSTPVTRPRPAEPQERPARRERPAWVAWSGWAVAASFACVAVWAATRPPKEVEKVVEKEKIVEKIVEVPKEVIREVIVYQEPPAAVVKAEVDKDPKAVRFAEAKGGVTANVLWSDAKKQGYLEIRGLPLNNPNLKQYQLWVIDKNRGPDPISAGVFDVKPDGTTLVRVDASLRFGGDSAAAFAISKEAPGGVAKPTDVVLVIPKKT